MINLETHTFDEIPVGYVKNFSVKITEEILNNFANISGDFNPLHMDEQHAKTTQFKRRVCHGMLLASFFSRLLGMYIPGKFSLYFSQSLNFRAPCFIGDEITITGTVTEKHNSTKMLTLKTVIFNQDENCLVDGIAKVIVRD
jgi:acyl dehydratase